MTRKVDTRIMSRFGTALKLFVYRRQIGHLSYIRFWTIEQCQILFAQDQKKTFVGFKSQQTETMSCHQDWSDCRSADWSDCSHHHHHHKHHDHHRHATDLAKVRDPAKTIGVDPTYTLGVPTDALFTINGSSGGIALLDVAAAGKKKYRLNIPTTFTITNTSPGASTGVLVTCTPDLLPGLVGKEVAIIMRLPDGTTSSGLLDFVTVNSILITFPTAINSGQIVTIPAQKTILHVVTQRR